MLCLIGFLSISSRSGTFEIFLNTVYYESFIWIWNWVFILIFSVTIGTFWLAETIYAVVSLLSLSLPFVLFILCNHSFFGPYECFTYYSKIFPKVRENIAGKNTSKICERALCYSWCNNPHSGMLSFVCLLIHSLWSCP